jgi:hypothetical protein
MEKESHEDILERKLDNKAFHVCEKREEKLLESFNNSLMT